MRLHALAPIVLTASIAALVAVAPLQAQTARDALVRKLDSLAGDPVREGRAAGIAVAIVRGNDTLLLKGYGKADVEWQVPMPADAVFEIGSVTKQFTAAALLQLRDEGRLSLDDDITKYVPAWKPAHRLTLRRLLDHTSGIRGITEMREFSDLVVTMRPRDSALALIKRAPFDFTPGEAMIYNNSAFWLLGLVVEQASGMSYEDYVEQKLFAPLGMKRSMYCNSGEVVERRAHGYGYRGRDLTRAPQNVHRWPYAAGSLCSTAGDMAAWLRALHGGRVLSPKSYSEMITPSRLADGTALRYGMGIGVGEDARGHHRIGHGGAIAGFVSEATWYPDAELAVVVLTNSIGGVSPSALASELAAEVLPPRAAPAPKAFSGDAASLVGKYSGPSRGRSMTVEVARHERGISVSVDGARPRPLPWVDGWTFRAGGAVVTFRRAGSSGPATELRWDTGSGHYVLKRQ